VRTYRNTKTGVVITVTSELKGDWEEVTNPLSSAKQGEEKPKRAPRKTKK